MKKITSLVFSMFSIVAFAQDDCATALPVTAGALTIIESINGTEIPSPDCTQFGQDTTTAADWFSYTAGVTGIATVTSDLDVNVGLDTRFSIYTGTCGALVCFGSADDVNYPANALSALTFVVESGITYYIVWDNQWSNDGFTFEVTETAVDCTTTIPYDGNLDDAANAAVCYTKVDGNENGNSWLHEIFDANADGINESIFSNASDFLNEKDDYLFSPAFVLEAGVEYEITYKFNAFAQNGNDPDEILEVLMTNSPTANASFSQQIDFQEGIVQNGDFATIESEALTSTVTFTPLTDGEYFIGFHAMSPAESAFLLLFDYQISPALATPTFEGQKINMYPNPVRNELTIVSPVIINSVDVYNLIGQKVLNQNSNSSTVNVNMSQLSAGTFMVKLVSETTTTIQKVVKQ